MILTSSISSNRSNPHYETLVRKNRKHHVPLFAHFTYLRDVSPYLNLRGCYRRVHPLGSPKFNACLSTTHWDTPTGITDVFLVFYNGYKDCLSQSQYSLSRRPAPFIAHLSTSRAYFNYIQRRGQLQKKRPCTRSCE